MKADIDSYMESQLDSLRDETKEKFEKLSKVLVPLRDNFNVLEEKVSTLDQEMSLVKDSTVGCN